MRTKIYRCGIDGLTQDFSKFSKLAMELLQSYAKPSLCNI